MTDPEHLNDLKEMTIGHAAREAFLHAAHAGGFPEEAFHPFHLDLYALLVLTVGERCTDRDVSSALHLAGDRIEGAGDAVYVLYADWFVLKPTSQGEGDEEPVPIPVDKFIREAAAALAALRKYEVGERVLVGRDRATATPAVIVAALGEDEWRWHVAEEPSGEARRVDLGDLWRAPLAQATSLHRRDDG